ncbi:putative chromatin regulator PHD family [Helianthus anomalus]
MSTGQCHRRRKMMGRSANGGCGTEEKHCPVNTSRVPNKSSLEDIDTNIDIDTGIGKENKFLLEDAPLARTVGVGVDLYSQACKALAVVSPFDVEDGQGKSSTSTSGVVTTLPAGLASCLTKHVDSRKRHKKTHLTDTKKNNKVSSRQEKGKGSSIWVETEGYFRELSVEDVERLNGTSYFRGNAVFTIPFIGHSASEINNHGGAVVAGGEQHDVNQFMEVDGVGGNDSTQKQEDENTGVSLPQSSSGVEWLLGSRSKIYLTSERPSKKRKLLGGEAGLEKLFVARPVKDQEPSTCCHYCSLGDTGNQLNRLIVCKSCGVAVHQRCYGVQQDDGDGCWECSWCRLKRDEDEITNGRCLLCSQQGGALKPVRKRGNDDGGTVEFAHLFCCQWMAEVYIEDTKSMEPIMNIEGIKDVQKKLVCCLCKVKCGACVRCSYGSCRTSFHPVCAREARHRMEIWGKFGCDDVELRAFCSKHSEAQKEGSASIEDGVLGTKSNLKSQTDCIDGAEVKGSSTAEDAKVSGSNNVTLMLKKLIDRGNVNLNDLASEISISANSLASNLADDCLPPELHGKVVKWLINNVHGGGLQKSLKLKVKSTKAEKESGGENAIVRASDNNAGGSPVKLAPSRKKTKGNIRVLKDNGLVLSLKRSSADDGAVLDENNNGGNLPRQESSPDSKEKISPESCPASDRLPDNTADHKGAVSENGCGQVDGGTDSSCDTRVKSNLASHDCSIAINDSSVHIRTEASPGSYIHPLICLHNQVSSKMKADEDDGHEVGYDHPNQNSASIESSCELEKTKRMSIVSMSPVDEVEGELVYYQHQLLCNAAARKHISDVLISKVTKCLPQEIESVRRHSWDAVLVSQYLSDLREVRKQGRKERRHKEAQAVLAAATAAAAASSRLSSLRKDTVDESPHQENTLKIKAFGGRSALQAQQVPQAKETHPKLSVTWTSPEMNFNASSSTLENKVHSRVCDVCRRAETILNPIIVCSSCKVAVHIDCYRSVKDSTGPWFCELCEDLVSSRSRGTPSRVGECGLCGGTTGAFRKSTDGQWVHAFCAEWVLESTFRRGQVKAIEGMEAISKGNDICLVCSRKEGVCIKCNYGHCQSTFHPTCGSSVGFYMNVRTIGGKIQHKAYCEKHSLVERTKAETQKHGAEEWNSLKKVRVELERLRLICERIIRREKLKRELILCSHDMLRCNRESISSSMRVCTTFVSPDVSSESATTSLRGGYTNSYNSRSETIQRSDDVTIDSTVAGKRRVKFPMPTSMDNDQKTDDSSTSQIFTQTPTVRPQLAGKQIPQRPSAVSRSASDDVSKFFRHGKHAETFEKEVVMTSDQASMRNQRLPKGFVYVPIRCLSNEEETIAAAAAAAAEENSGQDE